MGKLEGTLTSGKKWASGSGQTVGYGKSSEFNYANSTSSNRCGYVDITLSFTPSTIVMYERGNADEGVVIYNKKGIHWNANTVKSSRYDGDTHQVTTYNYCADAKVNLGNNVYRLPGSVGGFSVSWEAYE